MCAEMGIHGDEQAVLTNLAMVHDLDEVITGDLPTVTKDRYRALGFEPNDITKGWDLEPRNSWEKHLVKIADLMEATWWLGEHKVGRHARTVWLMMQGQTEARIDELVRLQPDIGRAARSAWKQMNTGEFVIE